MADYQTAGTFVGAVLEQSGYLVQSRFLVDFRDFFREAGAFVYLLGGIGGVVSVVLFGSYRMARYLVLGPVLYWFLLGPTTTFDGVAWQVGGGAPRAFDRRVVDVSLSAADVQKVIDRSGLDYNGGQVEVAYFFGMYAKVINSVTRDLSLQIINNDDPEYQHAISKARALEYLTNVEPDNALLKHMFEKNLLTDCMWMTGAALDASGYDVHPEAISAMSSGAKQTHQRRRQFDLAMVEKGKKDQVALKTTNSGPLTEYLAANRGKNLPDAISCDEVWKVVAEAITNFSREVVKPIVMKVARGNDADEQQVCERIREKLVRGGGGGGGGCDLTNLIAIFVLRNSLANQPVMARMAQWIVNDSQSAGPMEDEAKLDFQGRNLGGNDGSAGLVTALGRRQFYKNLHTGLDFVGALARNPLGAIRGQTGGDIYADRAKSERTARWTAEAKMQSIGGGADPAFTQMPRFNMRNLRQMLFSWSLQLPFWQGLLLYLLAIAYPFFALVVLLPGRAPSFLILPMAWLWVKSWDVGFACVLVFERVLWNVLPTTNISPNIANTPLSQIGIVEAMGEAQKFDHVWNLHMYYTLLALATLSVPMVMGVATIKAKRSVLSSFTDKLVRETKMSGQMAAQAYQFKKAGDFSRMREDMSGMAAKLIGASGQGIPGGGRGQQAMAQAALRAGGKVGEAVSSFQKGEDGFGQKTGAAVADVVGAARTGLGAWADTVQNQAKFDRAEMMAFDPVLGYYGVMQRYAKAYAVAMDTSGGFEISGQNNPGTNAINEYISLITGKLESSITAAGDGASSLLHFAGANGHMTETVLGAAIFTQLYSLSEERKAELAGHLDNLAKQVGVLSAQERAQLEAAIRDRNFDALPQSLMMIDGTLRGTWGDATADAFFNNALSFSPQAMARYKELMAQSPEQREQTLRALMPQNYGDLIESVNPYSPEYLRNTERMPPYFGELHWVRPPFNFYSEEDLRTGDGSYYPYPSSAPAAEPVKPSPTHSTPPAAEPVEIRELGDIGESINKLPGGKK